MLQRVKSKIKYWSGIKKLSILVCVILLGTVTAGSTFAYIVTGTPSLVNLFVNGMNPSGNLIIEKTLTHPYGDKYVLPEGLEFDFEVDLGDELAGETVETTQGDKVADEKGIINVSVAPGSRTTVYNIDGGTKVRVRETDLGRGFTADRAKQEITVRKHKDNVLTFVNTYKADKADTKALTVRGSKSLEGREWQDGDRFIFQLEVYEGDKWVSLGEEKVEYKKDTDFNQFDFTKYIQKYDFDDIGTYAFRVTEAEGNIGGITYDKIESYFDVHIGDADMDGMLEISGVHSESANTAVNGTDVMISFVNKYAPAGSAQVSIDIVKKLDDRSGQNLTPAGFEFELLDENGSIVKTSDVTHITGNTSMVLTYTPEDAGKVFNYTLREKNGGRTVDGMVYDDEVYDVRVVVKDNLDGTVSANIGERFGKRGDVLKVEFENVYDPADAAVQLNGEKRLNGRAQKAGEFTFRLYRVADDRFSLDGAQLIDTAKNSSNGEFAFAVQNYAKTGTYRYLIVEDGSASIRGINYDTTSYRVTVVVTDVNGKLKVDKTIVNDKGQAAQLIFNNEYVAESAGWSLTVKKVLLDENGNVLPMDAGEFMFDIYAADEHYVQQGGSFMTVENTAAGLAKFDGISFARAGVYRYLVVERIPDGAPTTDFDPGVSKGPYVRYDDAVYCIIVTVEDSGDGQLKVADVEIFGDGEEMAEVVFTNIYVSDKPAEPSDPVEPSEPSEPSDPSDPSGPSDPSDPSEPSDPSDPSGPSDPSDPSDPTDPDDPSAPSKPTEPTGPDNPTKPSKPQDGLDEPADKDKGTQTGDDFNMGLAVAVLILGAGVAAAAVLTRRKYN